MVNLFQSKGARRCAVPAAFLLLYGCIAPGDALAQAGCADSTRPSMTLAQVVDTMIARNAERAKALESYQGTRTYAVQYRGLLKTYQARLVAVVTYQAPGAKEFRVISQSGAGFLIRRVLKRLIQTERTAQQAGHRRNVDLNRRNYDFTNLQRDESSNGGCVYVVSVRPRHPNVLLYRGRIWIDDKDYAVCRMEVEPSRRPSFWIKETQISQTYCRVGSFWLPKSNRSVSKIRLGGTATLTIENSDQKVNAANPPVARAVSVPAS